MSMLAGLAMVAALVGCSSSEPVVATPTPEPMQTTVVETAPPSAEASLPTDCGAVGAAATRAATVDEMTLQGDGEGFQRPAPDGAEPVLGCDWILDEVAGYLLLISEVDAASARSYAESTLPGRGYSCGDGNLGALLCQSTMQGASGTADTVETIYVRDGVWIYQSATNTDGETLLADLVASIWAA
ncbi:hypothetical protein F6J84_05150 [Microbacterium caowuchunii]|uniref:hypothetical protein n=1 Tax=Microbacterium caowuchunii TaxID=2614638 RepID=UPI0012480692|nr:hypothetical protein [Microbacterium caowuchunii]QEV99547.1 hypothetical protein F6J84_05150 [Microbacterium caowuchunii]